MPVRKAKDLTHTLVAGLKDMISGGELHPGSKLPPERDLRFHEAIWHASGNRVCQRMFSSLHRAMTRSLTVTSSLRDEGTPVSAHEQMYNAIEAGEAEKARRLMFDHLVQGESTLLK